MDCIMKAKQNQQKMSIELKPQAKRIKVNPPSFF